MKNKKLTKLLIPLLLVMALMININRAKAQVPCDSAILLTQTSTCNYYNQTVTAGNTEYWYKFVADTTNAFIQTMQYGVPVGQQANISLYRFDGSCNNLTLVKQSNKTLFTLGLNQNATYYLRIYQYNPSNFGICTQK